MIGWSHDEPPATASLRPRPARRLLLPAPAAHAAALGRPAGQHRRAGRRVRRRVQHVVLDAGRRVAGGPGPAGGTLPRPLGRHRRRRLRGRGRRATIRPSRRASRRCWPSCSRSTTSASVAVAVRRRSGAPARSRRGRHDRLRHAQPRRDLRGRVPRSRTHAQLIDAGRGRRAATASTFELSGFAIQGAEQTEFGSEGIGLLAAVVILLISFGSVLAMGLPILTALFGLGIGTGLIALLCNVLEVPEFAPQVAAMIGIGVGIDYVLFIVTRYRAALQSGHEPREAVDHRDHDVGPGGAVRRLHRDHLAARPVRDEPRLPAGPRRRGLVGRAGRDAGRRSRCSRPCSASSGTTSTGSRCRSSARKLAGDRRSLSYRWSRVDPAPARGRRDRVPRVVLHRAGAAGRSTCTSGSPTPATTPRTARPARPTT